MNYFEFHLGDWAAATAHLTWLEDMAYTRLLRHYYHHERPVSYEQRYKICRATSTAQRKSVDAVISEFFEVVAGECRQKRADEEIARYREKSQKARNSAMAGVASRQAANAERTLSERPANGQRQTPASLNERSALQSPVTSIHTGSSHPNLNSEVPPHEQAVDNSISAGWDEFVKSDGSIRDECTRAALEAIGGYSKFRMRTTAETPKMKRDFCEAYRKAYRKAQS